MGTKASFLGEEVFAGQNFPWTVEVVSELDPQVFTKPRLTLNVFSSGGLTIDTGNSPSLTWVRGGCKASRRLTTCRGYPCFAAALKLQAPP